MGDHSGDAGEPRREPHRSTSQGRHYGNISYAAEEQAHAEDLRRRASLGIQVDQVQVHWTERPSRSTGARRRVI
jgi:hypothetical protein